MRGMIHLAAQIGRTQASGTNNSLCIDYRLSILIDGGKRQIALRRVNSDTVSIAVVGSASERLRL